MKDYKGKIFTCERCEFQWPQRPNPKRDKANLRIIQMIDTTPKFCPDCKSPSWNIPRNA